MLKDFLYLVAPNPVGMACVFVIAGAIMFIFLKPRDGE